MALVITAASALVISSTAFAANSLNCGHGDCDGGQFVSQRTGGHPGGTLPYSGLNLAMVALIAMLLIASGFALHRASGRRT
jgi:hypothetical protein